MFAKTVCEHMTFNGVAKKERTTAPEEAFPVLGDETRLQILRTLGEADTPLVFSELYDRVEYDGTANFNYHLTKLAGLFVRETDEGYTLRRAESRIVEAVLSGAVTDDPVLDRAPVDMPCPMCGGSMEVSYREESIVGHCSECSGTRSGASVPPHWPVDPSDDIVGHLRLPPAGIHERTPTEPATARPKTPTPRTSPETTPATGVTTTVTAQRGSN